MKINEALKMVWDACPISDEDWIRMVEAISKGYANMDSELTRTHLDRTRHAYGLGARLHAVGYAKSMLTNEPMVLIARARGSALRVADGLISAFMLESRGHSEYLGTTGSQFARLSDLIGDDEVMQSLKEHWDKPIHIFSFADNNEDFAHRLLTPVRMGSVVS